MALPDVEAHRWTRKEYEKAAYAGAFGDRPVELIDGVVYDMIAVSDLLPRKS